MTERGPIDTYLRDLRARLPYPAPRFLLEAREHLVDAAAKLLAAGAEPDEAESNAVERYGPIDEVVAAVKREGSPMMSPRVLRWILPLAGLLTLPSAVFLGTNGIEHLAGSDGGEGVFGASLDRWQTPLTGLLVLGPPLALALIVLAGTRIELTRPGGGLSASIDVKLTRGSMFAVIVIGLIVAAIAFYGITESLNTPGGAFGGDWSCTALPNNRMSCVSL